MKSLIVPLLATASFSTFLICGMVAASSMNFHYTPHKFANINASIWTSTPMRVDRSAQAFTREPGLAPVQIASSDNIGKDTSETLGARIIQTSVTTDIQQPATAAAEPNLASACQARYRSYRESDNTYQPFNGGPRRQCELTAQSANVGMTVNDTSSTVAQNPEQDHATWCEARYSSYRIADDTYQPLGGGERRRCASPMIAGANG